MSVERTEAAGRRARAGHPDEETRYRAVAELDPADAQDLAVLVERLGDSSWRVRSAAADRVAGAPGVSAVAELVRVLAHGPGAGAREAAAAALARVGVAAVPAVLEALGAGAQELRQAAAGVLGAIGDARAVAPLTARLADPDANVRAAAAAALGRIGGLGAGAALRAAVESDDATLRLSAVEALASLRASLPAADLARLMAERPLRRSLYRMLGAAADPAGLVFVGRGAADPSRPVREAALGALGRQRVERDRAAVADALAEVRAAAARDPGLCDAWAAALGSEDAFVVAGAISALAAAGSARHAGAMVKLAEDERHRALVEEALESLPPGAELRAALAEALPALGRLSRVIALAGLARMGSPAALESVVREASDRGSYVQADAIAALGRLNDARAVPPLAGLLADEDPATGALAAAALARIGRCGPGERDAVLAAVRDRCETCRAPATYRILGAVGGADDVAFVTAGLAARDAPERAAAAAAARALAERGVIGALGAPPLTAALSDPDWTVRAAAARALGALARGGAAAGCARGGAVRGALVAALDDPEAPVRAAAVEALGACGAPDDAGRVAALALADGASAQEIAAALRSLPALGPVSAAAVARGLGHADAEVVKEAVLAAAGVPGEAGVRMLRDAAASPRWDVRNAAAQAFARRGDPALKGDAERLSGADPDPLVARAFAHAARALGDR
jgi:HEAT repeat protein